MSYLSEIPRGENVEELSPIELLHWITPALERCDFTVRTYGDEVAVEREVERMAIRKDYVSLKDVEDLINLIRAKV